ncbi:MBL fold metallo-hydrolase [Streptomyces umbrinus]|uniref:MBL fold metallo-hydrolase n=1 Tax=Streptomyces umbrinus TaxID=67370 RepID=UPI0033E94C0F
MVGAAALAATGSAVAAPASAQSRPPTAVKGYRTKLVLLGTAGGPVWYAGTDRVGISSALAVGDRYYLIDAGDGVGHRLRASGLGSPGKLVGPLDTLNGIFLTHLHSDHISDVNNLLSLGMSNGVPRNERLPIPVWGPGNRGALPPLFGPPPEPPVVAPDHPTPGTVEMIDLLVRAFATDFNDRARDNRQRVPDQMFEAHDVPIPPEYLDDPNGDPHPRMSPVTFYEDDWVRVSATLVQHAPVFPALAFRFDTEDGSVVFSGDTGTSDNLVELATDADVLVHEVIDRDWVEQQFPEPRSPVDESIIQHLLTAHTTIEEVGPIAERAGVGTLVLNHLVPADAPDRIFRRAQDGFSGRLVVGHDLDHIGVGARTPRR